MNMMMNTNERRGRAGTLVAGLIALCGLATAQAQTETLDFDAVEEKLRTLAPTATTVAISETPVDGLLQAQINSAMCTLST